MSPEEITNKSQNADNSHFRTSNIAEDPEQKHSASHVNCENFDHEDDYDDDDSFGSFDGFVNGPAECEKLHKDAEGIKEVSTAPPSGLDIPHAVPTPPPAPSLPRSVAAPPRASSVAKLTILAPKIMSVPASPPQEEKRRSVVRSSSSSGTFEGVALRHGRWLRRRETASRRELQDFRASFYPSEFEGSEKAVVAGPAAASGSGRERPPPPAMLEQDEEEDNLFSSSSDEEGQDDYLRHVGLQLRILRPDDLRASPPLLGTLSSTRDVSRKRDISFAEDWNEMVRLARDLLLGTGEAARGLRQRWGSGFSSGLRKRGLVLEEVTEPPEWEEAKEGGGGSKLTPSSNSTASSNRRWEEREMIATETGILVSALWSERFDVAKGEGQEEGPTSPKMTIRRRLRRCNLHSDTLFVIDLDLCSRMLSSIYDRSHPSHFEGHVPHGFQVVTHAKSTVYRCANHAEKEAWLDILERAVLEARRDDFMNKGADDFEDGWTHRTVRRGLFSAAVCSDVAMVRTILADPEQAKRVNDLDSLGFAAIHYAAMYGCDDTLLQLMAYGADPNATTRLKRTPAHYAAQKSRRSTLRILLDKGAKVDSRDIHGNQPLHLLTVHGEKYCDSPLVVKLLHRNGALMDSPDYDGNSPLHLCAALGSPRVALALLHEGASPNCRRSSDCATPLLLTCTMPFAGLAAEESVGTNGTGVPVYDAELLRNLIGGGAYVNLADDAGHTALHILLAGRYGGELAPHEGENGLVREEWAFGVFLGVMELLRGGAFVSEELRRMLPKTVENIMDAAVEEMPRARISLAKVAHYADRLFPKIDPGSTAAGRSDDAVSAACELCGGASDPQGRVNGGTNPLCDPPTRCILCHAWVCVYCSTMRLPVKNVLWKDGRYSLSEDQVCDACFNRTVFRLSALQQQDARYGPIMDV